MGVRCSVGLGVVVSVYPGVVDCFIDSFVGSIVVSLHLVRVHVLSVAFWCDSTCFLCDLLRFGDLDQEHLLTSDY